MGLSIIIILFALAILVFAFVGVFGRFPDNWEWVGIVLAGWGVAMSAQSLLQMVIGQPKLRLQFDRIVKDRERTLALFLKNQQFGDPLEGKKSVWRKLGVKRDTIESLTVSFRISNAGTREVLIPVMQARIYEVLSIGV